MEGFKRILIVGLGVAALAVPAGAIANPDHSHGKPDGHAKAHNVAYIFKGLYAGEGKVEVKAGNSRVRKGGLIGATVSFDLSSAQIVVADTNGDGQKNLEDAKTGDKVLAKAMLPRNDPGSQPFAATRLVDQTHPAS